MRLGAKKVDFGSPLAPSWGPNGPKIVKKLSGRCSPFRDSFLFESFWCDLVPKRSILGAPWRPAGPQMAPKITQVVPKSHPSGAKKGPESIIPRIVLRHWKRAMINEKNNKKRLPKNIQHANQKAQALFVFHEQTTKIESAHPVGV